MLRIPIGTRFSNLPVRLSGKFRFESTVLIIKAESPSRSERRCKRKLQSVRKVEIL
jgi:hypothetical protein